MNFLILDDKYLKLKEDSSKKEDKKHIWKNIILLSKWSFEYKILNKEEWKRI